MADSRIRDTILAISTANESSYNGMIVLASAMSTLVTRSSGIPAPVLEKTDDKGVIGNYPNGEFATLQRSGFVIPPAFEISNVVSAEMFFKQVRRFLGLADPTPAAGDIIEAGIAFKHHAKMLPNNTGAGLQLPSSTFAFSNNGLDYLYAGCCGNTLQIQQQGGADPTYSIGYVGSGKYKRIRDVSGPVFGSFSAPAAQNYMLGPSTELEFTDDVGLVSLTTAHRLRNVTINVQNNLRTDLKLAGASPIDPADLKKGWYLDSLTHGDRDAGATMRVALDDTLREFYAANNDTDITNFTMRMRGYTIPTTAAANRFTIEVIFGKCHFNGQQVTDDGGDACLDINISPCSDLVNFGIVKVDCINNVATAIA
jgi:hypothetical protein